MDAEMDSIRTKEDIVSLHNGREWATFDGGVETVIGQIDRLLQKVFRTESLPLQVIISPFAAKPSYDADCCLEILPHTRGPRKDNKPLRLLLQQLPHRQTRQRSHYRGHLLSPGRPRRHYVPAHKYCHTCRAKPY